MRFFVHFVAVHSFRSFECGTGNWMITAIAIAFTSSSSLSCLWFNFLPRPCLRNHLHSFQRWLSLSLSLIIIKWNTKPCRALVSVDVDVDVAPIVLRANWFLRSGWVHFNKRFIIEFISTKWMFHSDRVPIPAPFYQQSQQVPMVQRNSVILCRTKPKIENFFFTSFIASHSTVSNCLSFVYSIKSHKMIVFDHIVQLTQCEGQQRRCDNIVMSTLFRWHIFRFRDSVGSYSFDGNCVFQSYSNWTYFYLLLIRPLGYYCDCSARWKRLNNNQQKPWTRANGRNERLHVWLKIESSDINQSLIRCAGNCFSSLRIVWNELSLTWPIISECPIFNFNSFQFSSKSAWEQRSINRFDCKCIESFQFSDRLRRSNQNGDSYTQFTVCVSTNE